MYKGLDLSECPVIVEVEEEEEEEHEEERPFDESSSNNDDDDPFSIDGNGDFDPFLDYPGESNDIADPAPSQRSTPDDADTSAATAAKTPSTTTKTTTKEDGGAE